MENLAAATAAGMTTPMANPAEATVAAAMTLIAYVTLSLPHLPSSPLYLFVD